jgi:predicted nucleic acid-binding protein
VTGASARAVVVDSSVAVKWFVDEGEAHVEAAMDLLWRHSSGEIVLAAPELLLFEVSAALARRNVSEDRQLAAVNSLSKMHIEWEPLVALHAESVALANRHGLSVYDASFAVLAARLGGPLVTADRKLAHSGACEAELLGTSEGTP